MQALASTNANLLAQAAETFAHWRTTRTGRGRIPEPLDAKPHNK